MGVPGLLRVPFVGVVLLLLFGLKGEATIPFDIARTTLLLGLVRRLSKSGSMIVLHDSRRFHESFAIH